MVPMHHYIYMSLKCVRCVRICERTYFWDFKRLISLTYDLEKIPLCDFNPGHDEHDGREKPKSL